MAFKTAMGRLLRFVIIAVLACVVYILGYSIITGIKEFILAIPVAAGIVFTFLKSNPALLVVCAVCIFFAAVFYDRIKAKIAAQKEKLNKNK